MAFFDLRIGGSEHRRLNLREAIHRVVSAAIGAGSTPEELRPLFPQGKNAWHALDGSNQWNQPEWRSAIAAIASKHPELAIDMRDHGDASAPVAPTNISPPASPASAVTQVAKKDPCSPI